MRWKVISGAALAAATSLLYALEGERLETYLDTGGVPTVCQGVTGPDIKMGQIYTKEECRHMNSREVNKTIAAIERVTTRPLPDEVGAAAISFAYNVGPTGYARSTALKRFNRGDFKGGCEAMMWWVCDDVRPGTGAAPGQQCGRAARDKAVIRGLVNRRKKEVAFCLKGVK